MWGRRIGREERYQTAEMVLLLFVVLEAETVSAGRNVSKLYRIRGRGMDKRAEGGSRRLLPKDEDELI